MKVMPKPIRRVLLVSTNMTSQNDYEHRIMPTQLDYLASELKKKGIEVKCLDLALHGAPFVVPPGGTEERFHRDLSEQRKALLVREVEEGGYDLVGLSFRNLDLSLVPPQELVLPQVHFLEQVESLVNAVSQLPKKPTLVMGGAAFSLFPKALLQRWQGIDFGVVGAGEAALPWLIDQINAGTSPKRGAIHQPFNFSEASFTRGHIELARYFEMALAASVQTKRGCDALCTYCNYPAIEGTRYQLRSPYVVVDEIQALNQEHHFQAFYFLDSVFNWPAPHAKRIMQEIIRRGLDIRYDAMINPRGIDEEFVDLAEASGLFKTSTLLEKALVYDQRIRQILMSFEEAREEGDDIQISDGGVEFYGYKIPALMMKALRNMGRQKQTVVLGIDSGDDAELAQTRKRFTTADIRRVTGMLSKRSVPFSFDLLFGGPATTEQSIRNTMQLAIETGARSVLVQLGVRVYPKTRLAAATHGTLWQTPADLLPLTPFPCGLEENRMRDVIEEYGGKIKLLFHFDRRLTLF
ncbi:MAG: cobalamin-dependent protein [Candidatus Saganbacteria bacterium]|nr:cobalamin-dependent protein [Candidatus Saganbacteria bacterium]